jgi:hypothetical protein
MRYFPDRLYAALGLRLATFSDGLGMDVRPGASALLDLRAFYPMARWPDGPGHASAPRALIFDWHQRPPNR